MNFTVNRSTNLLALAVALLAGNPAAAFLRPAQIPESEAPAQPAPKPAGTQRPIVEPQFDSYDRAIPDYGRLQRPEDALQGFPLDENGKVDWARALRDGVISPREVLQGDKTYLPLDLDIVMRNTKGMPYVRFPHKTHTEWLACSNCHPAIFAQKAGTSRIRMEDIFRGEFCGKCHDRVAFITHRACFRCHSVAQPGQRMPN